MFDGMMDEHDENGIEPTAPATQHRVIPVEWHRVAVEPGDNAPARVEPICKTCGIRERWHGPGMHQFESAAQPASTDARQADTIPDSSYVAQRDEACRQVTELTDENLALETRIEVLEAALRGLLQEYDDQKSQFGHDSIWKKYEDMEAVEAARAALAAPSGETK